MLPLEQRTEHQPGNFSIKFSGSGEIFQAISQQQSDIEIELVNNWEEIADRNYDPIISIKSSVASSLVIEPDAGRQYRTLHALEFYFKISVGPYATPDRIAGELTSAFDKVGIPTQFVVLNREYEKEEIYGAELIKRMRMYDDFGRLFQSINNFDPKIAIKLFTNWDPEKGNVGTDGRRYSDYALVLDWGEKSERFFLTTKEDFDVKLSQYFDIMNKGIQVVYIQTGKEILPGTLTVKPWKPKETPTENPVRIHCDYCTGSYLSSFDACTNCGAPRP